jgi:anti-anti-sigma factor
LRGLLVDNLHQDSTGSRQTTELRVLFYSNILPNFALTIHYLDDQVTVSLSGELTGETAPILLESVERILVIGVARVLVDLSDLQACDSFGIGALTQAWTAVRSAGADLTVDEPGDATNTRQRLNAVLEVMGGYRLTS